MSFSRRNEEKERKIPANNGDIVNQNLSPNSPIINLKKIFGRQPENLYLLPGSQSWS